MFKPYVLPIRSLPPIYRPSVKVKKEELKDPLFTQFVWNLCATLMASGGVGLAAPQVGVNKRVFAMRLPGQEIVAVLNPEFVYDVGSEFETQTEGCLSIPGRLFDVERPVKARLSGRNLAWTFIEEEITGYAARVVAHEADHLYGCTIEHIGSQIEEVA